MSKFFEALERAEKERAGRVDVARSAQADPTESPADPAATSISGAPQGGEQQRPKRTLEAELGPSVVDDGFDRIDDHLIGLLAPNAPESEHYRRLCHLIREKRQSAALSTIAISSPGSADGKTTTSINIAGLLAHHSGLRVLLLEADLRAPSLASKLGLTTPSGRGLADALTRPGTTLESVTSLYTPLNLGIVPAGDSHGHPYDLISSPRFGELFTQARHQFEYVIVDAPPLTPFPDCRIIAGWVDAFVIVVGAHHTPRRLLEESLTTVDSSKILGLLFNGADWAPRRDYPGYSRGWRYNGARAQTANTIPRRSWRIGRKANRP